MRLPLILFIILPILELIVFIEVGSIIGSAYVILSIIFSALLGYIIIKYRLKNIELNLFDINNFKGLYKEYTSSVYIFIGSILLIIPGYITDSLGIAAIVGLLRPKFVKYDRYDKPTKSDTSKKHNIIDAEYRDDD